jgi:hypothetical protein
MSDEPSSPNPPAPAEPRLALAAEPAAPAPPPAPGIPSSRLVTLNAIHWPNVLDFTQIFRSFRLAINPAKLALALLAILLIYTAGRLFDWAWGPQVYADEMQRYAEMTPEGFKALRARRLEARQESLDRLLANLDNITVPERANLKTSPAKAYGAIKANFRQQFAEALDLAARQRTSEEALGGSRLPNAPTPAENEQANRAAAANRLMGNIRNLNDIYGRGIFETFLKYETDQFDHLVDNTLTFVRITPVRPAPGAAPDLSGAASEDQAVSAGLFSRDPDRLWRSDTVLGCIANMTVTGPRWLFTATGPMQTLPTAQPEGWGAWIWRMGVRGLYLVSLSLLALFSLAVLAFTGASIARLSALELAGIERAPLMDVFVFAARRLWVFVKTPLVPFLILLGIGLAMALVALLGAIPFIGPILIGILFFAFLGVAFVLMLLLLGILGGFNLLYPTIAVEGADSFDAMSRSFAYVYARPWRLLLYYLCSLLYGVITLTFVCFCAYLILLLTHTFVGWGMNLFGTHYGAMSGVPELQTLWPEPRFLHLISPVNWYAMSWGEFIGALFLHFWVYLLIAGIGAYVISYYFSSHTIIYLLLRRSVDGQNLREIYLEEKPN